MISPAFQFYASDFLASTTHFTAEEVGAYVRMLCHQWTQGSVPSSPDDLSRICGCQCDRIARVLTKFKASEGGVLKNSRLEEVRIEKEAFLAKKTAAAKVGAAARWQPHTERIAVASNSHCQNDASSSSSSSSVLKEVPPTPTHFERVRRPTVWDNSGPSWEQVEKWVSSEKKEMGFTCTVEEAKAAFLSAKTGGWKWGSGPMVDWKSGLQKIMLDNRARTPIGLPNGSNGSPPPKPKDYTYIKVINRQWLRNGPGPQASDLIPAKRGDLTLKEYIDGFLERKAWIEGRERGDH